MPKLPPFSWAKFGRDPHPNRSPSLSPSPSPQKSGSERDNINATVYYEAFRSSNYILMSCEKIFVPLSAAIRSRLGTRYRGFPGYNGSKSRPYSYCQNDRLYVLIN